MNPRTAFLLALLCVVTSACNTDPPQLNLLLIVADTTRADRMGFAGDARARTPVLDRLAATGTTARSAWTHVPVTLPAFSTLLTGTLPSTHGVHDNGIYRLGTSPATLAERLAARGYRCGAVVSSYAIASPFGLSRGFEEYDDRFTNPGQSYRWKLGQDESMPFYYTWRSGEESTDRAIQWVRMPKDRPFFLLLHYFDPHAPYSPNPPWDRIHPGDPYRGEISGMDQQIGRLLRALREDGTLDSTLICFTADHGEALGDHGEPEHGLLLHGSTLQVPLILHSPRNSGHHRIVKGDFDLVDLAPTLLDLMGISDFAGMEGRSVANEWKAGSLVVAEREPAYLESEHPLNEYGWKPLYGVRSGPWRFNENDPPELYHLPSDPGEDSNVAPSFPPVAATLRNTLREEWSPGNGEESETLLDEEELRRLRSLGYVAAGSSSNSPSRRNARELLPVLPLLDRLREAEERAEYALARNLADSALAIDPENPVGLEARARIRRQTGDLEGYLSDLNRLISLYPGRIDVATAMAEVMRTEQGRVEEAVKLLRRALENRPDYAPARHSLGAALVQAGRMEEARTEFEAARNLYPSGSPQRRTVEKLLEVLEKRQE